MWKTGKIPKGNEILRKLENQNIFPQKTGKGPPLTPPPLMVVPLKTKYHCYPCPLTPQEKGMMLGRIYSVAESIAMNRLVGLLLTDLVYTKDFVTRRLQIIHH